MFSAYSRASWISCFQLLAFGDVVQGCEIGGFPFPLRNHNPHLGNRPFPFPIGDIQFRGLARDDRKTELFSLEFLCLAAEKGFRSRVDKEDHAEAVNDDDAVCTYGYDIMETLFTCP